MLEPRLPLAVGKITIFAAPAPLPDPRICAADKVGQLSLEQLNAWLPAERDVDVYFLGPKGFMGEVKRHLKALGVPEKQSR